MQAGALHELALTASGRLGVMEPAAPSPGFNHGGPQDCEVDLVTLTHLEKCCVCTVLVAAEILKAGFQANICLQT